MEKTLQMNIGMKLSRNYQTVEASFLDTPIVYDDGVDGDLDRAIKQAYARLRKVIETQFEIISATAVKK